MPHLRILTWNIQNLGRTKIQFADIMAAIAGVVAEEQPDILIVLEINTSHQTQAGLVGATIQRALQEREEGYWRTYAMSPGTGVEFYGFFIRDTARVRPVRIAGPVAGGPGAAPSVLNDPAVPGSELVQQRFETFLPPGDASVCPFPLIRPNLIPPHGHRVPPWTGARLPCMGLFRVEGAAQPYLPVLAGHFAANYAQATRQIQLLPAIDLVDGICNPNPPLRLRLDGADVVLPDLVITGDFNVHLDPALYPDAIARPVGEPGDGDEAGWGEDAGELQPEMDWAPVHAGEEEKGEIPVAVAPAPVRRKREFGPLLHAPQGKRSAGMRAAITGNTLLVKPRRFNSERMLNTGALAVECIDNHFLTRGLAVQACRVVDVPAALRRMDPFPLRESVAHYAEHGMRDLHTDPDEPVEIDDARLLLEGAPGGFTLRSLLIGTRLVSDHLPVVVEVNVP